MMKAVMVRGKELGMPIFVLPPTITDDVTGRCLVSIVEALFPRQQKKFKKTSPDAALTKAREDVSIKKCALLCLKGELNTERSQYD